MPISLKKPQVKQEQEAPISKATEESMKLQAEQEKLDRQQAKEKKAYDEYDKTRLKEQGSFKKGGKVSSASKRADGCAIRGKTRGKMV